MPVAARLEKRIPLPDGVSARMDGGVLTVEGPKGKLSREFTDPTLRVSVDGREIVIHVDLPKKREKVLMGTWNAHINNMIKGVTDGFRYTLKLVYSHFPVKMSVKGTEFVIENFEGEKSPRKARILPDVKVSVKGDQVVVEGINKEHVGQTAANIEMATRRRGYDPRVFQDGIYIVSKE